MTNFQLPTNKWTTKQIVTMLLIALVTTVAGEIKVIPFNDEMFRFGLGSIAFFLLILIRPPVSMVQTGFLTGVTVVCFRIMEDMLFGTGGLTDSIKTHLPAFIFYFLFALGLHLIKIENYKTTPLLLGSWAVLFEFVGNGAEQMVRSLLLNHHLLSLYEWLLIGGVALFRSFFVVGLYSSITVSEQKKRMQEMLAVGSELYAETLYLQKSMNHIEQITASSHELYRKLKKEDLQTLSREALLIAQEIHEVKKDSQRIYAGLTKLMKQEKTEIILLSNLLQFVIIANEKYSELLEKDITFRASTTVDFETFQHIPLLALMNNLVSNAVEAIEQEGEITLGLGAKSDSLWIEVNDSGQGIMEEDLALIFEPGYTTKFNVQGVAATGIGLSHVQEIVHTMAGEILVESTGKGTTFKVVIPMKRVRKWVE